MTTTDSEVIERYETAAIEALDFALPCDFAIGSPEVVSGTPCPEPAAWIAWVRSHHTGDSHTGQVLMCQRHYEWVTRRGIVLCSGCGQPVVMSDYITRLEPLKPSPTGAP